MLGDRHPEEQAAALGHVRDPHPRACARRDARRGPRPPNRTAPAIGLTSPETPAASSSCPPRSRPAGRRPRRRRRSTSRSRTRRPRRSPAVSALEREHGAQAIARAPPPAREPALPRYAATPAGRGGRPRARRARSPCRTRARPPRRRSRARGPCRGRRAASPGRRRRGSRSRRPSSSLSWVSRPAAGSSRQTSARLRDQRARDPDELALPLRELVRQRVGDRLEPEQLERRADLRRSRRRGARDVSRTVRQTEGRCEATSRFSRDGEVVEQLDRLPGAREPAACPGVRRQPGQVAARRARRAPGSGRSR